MKSHLIPVNWHRANNSQQWSYNEDALQESQESINREVNNITPPGSNLRNFLTRRDALPPDQRGGSSADSIPKKNVLYVAKDFFF